MGLFRAIGAIWRVLSGDLPSGGSPSSGPPPRLNCKSGDLAYITLAGSGLHQDIRQYLDALEGRIIKVVDVIHNAYGHPCWRFDGAPMRIDFPLIGKTIWAAAIPDAYLRPLADPGDEEVDQIVAHVGAPTLQPAESHT